MVLYVPRGRGRLVLQALRGDSPVAGSRRPPARLGGCRCVRPVAESSVLWRVRARHRRRTGLLRERAGSGTSGRDSAGPGGVGPAPARAPSGRGSGWPGRPQGSTRLASARRTAGSPPSRPEGCSCHHAPSAPAAASPTGHRPISRRPERSRPQSSSSSVTAKEGSSSTAAMRARRSGSLQRACSASVSLLIVVPNRILERQGAFRWTHQTPKPHYSWNGYVPFSGPCHTCDIVWPP